MIFSLNIFVRLALILLLKFRKFASFFISSRNNSISSTVSDCRWEKICSETGDVKRWGRLWFFLWNFFKWKSFTKLFISSYVYDIAEGTGLTQRVWRLYSDDVLSTCKREWESPCIGISIVTSFRVYERLTYFCFYIVKRFSIRILKNYLEASWKFGILIMFLWILLMSSRDVSFWYFWWLL